MANAHGTRHEVAYTTETTFGTMPSTPVFTALNADRSNGFTMNRDQTFYEDTSNRADGNRQDTFQGNYIARGTLSQVLRYGEMDTFFASLFGGSWTTNVLVNGTARTSLALERAWTDLGKYQTFNGVCVDSVKLEIPTDGTVKASWALVGTSVGAVADTSASASAYTAQATDLVFTEGGATITEGGSTLAYCTAISLSIERPNAVANVIGSNAAYDVKPGVFKVSGDLKALFPDATLYNKFVNHTSSSLVIVLSNGTNSYTLHMGKLRFTKAEIPATDGFVEQTLAFEAFFDETDAGTLKITRG